MQEKGLQFVAHDAKNRSTVPTILKYDAGDEAAPLPNEPTYALITPLSHPVA